MKILGIESTCDETAAAVAEFNGDTISRTDSPKINLLSSIVHTQIDIHAQYGGVIPEVAARSHIEYINPVIEKALHEANLTFDNIDGIGEVRKNKLLKKYKTITKMKEASTEELEEILINKIIKL